MIEAGHGGVLDTEIIHDEGERDGIGIMGPQSRREGCWVIAMRYKLLN